MTHPEDQTINNSPEDSSSTGQQDIASQDPVSHETSSDAVSKDVKDPATPSVADDPKKNDKPKSLLDTLKDVVKKPSNADSLPEGQKDEAKPKDKADPKEVDPEKDKAKSEEDARLDKHPRFIQLNERMKAAEKDANEYRQIDTFVKQAGLAYTEVAEGMNIMALMKQDPIAALEALQPTLEKLYAFAGHILPPDLKQKVENGLIDVQTAREAARTRHVAAHTSQRLNQTEQQRINQEQGQQLQQVQQQIQGAIVQWEESIKARDVDFAAKEPLLMDRVQTLMRANPPRSPQDAVAIVEQAYKDVSAHISKFAPQRRPINPGPSASSSSSTNSTAKVPATLQEAIRQSLKK